MQKCVANFEDKHWKNNKRSKFLPFLLETEEKIMLGTDSVCSPIMEQT